MIAACPLGLSERDLLWALVQAAGAKVDAAPDGLSQSDILWSLLNGGGQLAARSASTGDVVATLAAVRSGWIAADGKTIGDASSAADGRANADCEALFKLLWEIDQFDITGGKGATAAADWAAHKKIALPDLRGRALMGADPTNAALANDYWGKIPELGTTGGANAVVLQESQVPALTTDLQAFMFASSGSGPVNGPPGALFYTSENLALGYPESAGVTVGSFSPDAVPTIPPAMLINWLIKL